MRHLTSALTLAAVLVLAGCTTDRGTAPPHEAAGPALGGMNFLEDPTASQASLLSSRSVDSKQVSAASGATLSAGSVQVTIPPGALASDQMVVLRVPSPESVIFEIEPAGLVLAHPLEIRLNRLQRTDGSHYASLAVVLTTDDGDVVLPTDVRGNELVASAASTGGFAVAGLDETGAIVDLLRYLSSPGHVTEWITAGEGGEIRFGRFRLVLPAGALEADTWITIRNPGNGYLMCDLEPHGIQFLTPVMFEMNLNGLQWHGYDDWTVFWLNDDLDRWEDQGAEFSHARLRVYLNHFSKYVGGRAGW